nr:unnamed protein product [Callosobruchus chinensis]
MVRQCYLCKVYNYQEEGHNLSFHSFPVEPVQKGIWASLLGFETDHNIPKRAEICSKHFHPNDFECGLSGKRSLRKGAVPLARHSMFDSPGKLRNKNLRIFNFPEKNGEDLPQEIIRLCNSKLDVPIEKEDIVVCSRIGKKLSNRPRSILLKLAHVNSKQRIYKNKSRLKGSGIVIKEDLSEKRLKLMQVAIEKTSLKQVWSFNGSIYVLHRDKRHVIKNIGDVDGLLLI